MDLELVLLLLASEKDVIEGSIGEGVVEGLGVKCTDFAPLLELGEIGGAVAILI